MPPPRIVVSPDDLTRYSTAATIARGVQYADEGRVEDMFWEDDARTLSGLGYGSRDLVYDVDLTAADYCFLCDPWWSPAAEAQAVDRTHRIGQTRPVTVYRLVSQDTIEEKVVALQERKRQLFTASDVRELLG